MNKVNQREVTTAYQYASLGMMDTAARTLSACIRSSMRQSDINELRAVAADIGVKNHPAFIC